MIKHFKFIKDHHKNVKKIALVTDTKLADFAEVILSHFVSAVVKQFSANDIKAAREWVLTTNTSKVGY